MHLGMVIPEFPAQTHAFFWREICALRELGVRVSVVSTRRPNEPCRHEFANEATEETHYLFPPDPTTQLRALRRGALLRALPYLRSLPLEPKLLARNLGLAVSAVDLAEYARRHGIDHLHVHSCADAAHVAAMARRAGGPTYSLHLHGDLEVYGTHHQQKVRDALFVATAARTGQRQVIEELGFPEERALVMRMGVDTRRFEAAVDQTKADPVHVVTVGRLNYAKGHRFGLEAMRQIIDRGVSIRYSIAGSGPHQAEIETDIERLRLGSHVSMLGSLAESEVIQLLQRAHVFLLPSIGLGEASPVAVMEAMAAGLCVVCSRIGGTGDMISDGVDGFLTPQQDVGAIAAALGQLCEDGELRLRLSEAARQRARAEFDARVLAQRMLTTIDTLRGSAPSARLPSMTQHSDVIH